MRNRHPSLPTEAQTKVLRQIAQAGGVMMLTHVPDSDDVYSDQSGRVINCKTAKVLIRNGWVTAHRDSMFDLSPQTWSTKTPNK